MTAAKVKQTTSNCKKVPRPMNCFLAYRLEKQSEIVARCPGANHRDISKIIAKWWKEASDEEKAPYRERARIAKIEHARMYPDYKYTPQKKASKRRYTVRPKDKFTSRNEANNRMMQLLYNNPDALQYVPPVVTDSQKKKTQSTCASNSNNNIDLSITPPSPIVPSTTMDDPATLYYTCSSSATNISSPYSSRDCSPSSPELQNVDNQLYGFSNTCDWSMIQQQQQQSGDQCYDFSNINFYQSQYNTLYVPTDGFQSQLSGYASTNDASMQLCYRNFDASWSLTHPLPYPSQYPVIPVSGTNVQHFTTANITYFNT